MGAANDETCRRLTRELLTALAAAASTLAVAESLTGGLLAYTLTEAPGASEAFRGSVTAYATDTKAAVLHVDQSLLQAAGPVHPHVAAQMAKGVRLLMNATYGLATTGVAGPEPQGDHDPGTAYIAFASADHACSMRLHADGDRQAVQNATVLSALTMLQDHLRPGGHGHTGVVGGPPG
ncbi:CinA family protein [Streptomyces sp. SP17BM10]|uniref:CinA family protein n=1 Tax=Streptomyces sp. SP17BM10 TaxID=3002530 RepID=UPI002E7626C6|nr:CinA family protein [Streptomyces sp. SP17BM10]MEE1788267.1 CinA family protein [Streptomyces sp. SP17BM10]